MFFLKNKFSHLFIFIIQIFAVTRWLCSKIACCYSRIFLIWTGKKTPFFPHLFSIWVSDFTLMIFYDNYCIILCVLPFVSYLITLVIWLTKCNSNFAKSLSGQPLGIKVLTNIQLLKFESQSAIMLNPNINICRVFWENRC